MFFLDSGNLRRLSLRLIENDIQSRIFENSYENDKTSDQPKFKLKTDKKPEKLAIGPTRKAIFGVRINFCFVKFH
jgi:hypothetical protein